MENSQKQPITPPKLFVHAGHFYSPLPDPEEMQGHLTKLDRKQKKIPGVDLREKEQIKLARKFEKYYPDFPYLSETNPAYRFRRANDFFGNGDVVSLYGFMREFRPKQLIEIGSGHSSCAILDINEIFFKNRMRCTFIDPNPKNLFERLKPGDETRHLFIRRKVQDVGIAEFESLEAGDILFIDSSHVVKSGNDGMDIFFRILPHLKKGVIIHFHDIHWPFEYNRRWLEEGRAWNEAYFLRAFLQHNRSFKILFFVDFLAHFHPEIITPLPNKGGSFWLVKTAG